MKHQERRRWFLRAGSCQLTSTEMTCAVGAQIGPDSAVCCGACHPDRLSSRLTVARAERSRFGISAGSSANPIHQSGRTFQRSLHRRFLDRQICRNVVSRERARFPEMICHSSTVFVAGPHRLAESRKRLTFRLYRRNTSRRCMSAGMPESQR